MLIRSPVHHKIIMLLGLFALSSILMSGCAILPLPKPIRPQGNIISNAQIKQLKLNMSPAQVKMILGTPMLVNLFSADRLEYIYLLVTGTELTIKQQIICLFKHDKLQAIHVHSTSPAPFQPEQARKRRFALGS